MYSIDNATSAFKNLSTSEKAVFSDEVISLALEEGYIIGALKSVKHAIDPQIKAARVRDLNLGVFIARVMA